MVGSTEGEEGADVVGAELAVNVGSPVDDVVDIVVRLEGAADGVDQVAMAEDAADVVALHLAGLFLCTAADPVATESTTERFRRLVYSIVKCEGAIQ